MLSEWFEQIADDPASVVENFGSTYQEWMSPDITTEEAFRQHLADLSAWDTQPTPSSLDALVRHYEQVQLAAALEFAHALVALATKTGEVPHRVKPYVDELAPLVTALERALADGSFDDHSIDLHGVIWSET